MSTAESQSTNEKSRSAMEVEIELMTRIEELKKAEEKRQELRIANSLENVEAMRQDVASGKIKLKSDLKKSTAFVKKLKVLGDNNGAILCKDIGQLNLTRYISECVSAIGEANIKAVDIPAAVEVISLLHQRYSDFTAHLISTLSAVFDDSLTDDKAHMIKRRTTLRILTELYIAGVYSDVNIIVRIVQHIINRDKKPDKRGTKKAPLDVPLLVSFAKYAGYDFLGVTSRKNLEVEALANNLPQPIYRVSVVEDATQQLLLELYNKAYDFVCRMYLNEYESLKKKEKRNQREQLNKGEVSESNANELETSKRIFEKLQSSVTSLADTLNKDVPILPEEEKAEQEGSLSLWDGGDGRMEFHEGGPFDDEDTRSFYEDLPDLLSLVPAVVLGLSENEVAAIRQQQDNDATETIENEETSMENLQDESRNEELKDDMDIDTKTEKDVSDAASTNEDSVDISDESTTKSSTFHQIDVFIQQLEHMVNRDRCDKAATEFCYQNSKGARKRLVKALYSVPRTHLELLPYFSRLVAILHPVLKDIGPQLVNMLVDEFFYLQRKKNQNRLESKIKNIRFIGELTKFKVAPPNVAFRCLKCCLDDFQGHNIDTATTLLETCGRYLYRLPYTQNRISNYLDIMMRLKSAKSLDNRAETMVQNAYYMCKPPERTETKSKEYDPLYLYIMKVLYTDMNSHNGEKILKLMRKLPWKDPQTTDFVLKAALKVSKGKFMHMDIMCDIVAGLSRYYSSLGIRLVDAVMEHILLGLEQNDYRDNQRRIGFVKLLGQLYNYSLVNSIVIFDTLYLLINFGHNIIDFATVQNHSISDEIKRKYRLVPDMKYDPRVPCEADDVDNLFRIRLVCSLLETCGSYFDKGITKHKLDRFMTFFQRYIYTKEEISVEIEFVLLDMFESYFGKKGIKLPRFNNWESADEACNIILENELEEAEKRVITERERQGIRTNEDDMIAECNINEDEDDDEGDIDDEEDEEDDEEDDEEVDEGDDDADNDDETSANSDDDDDEPAASDDEEEIVLRDRPAKTEEDEEFEKAFRGVMQGSIDSRKHIARVNADNMAIPTVIKTTHSINSGDSNSGNLMFRVLKRGTKGKIEARQILIPEGTTIGKQNQRQESAERQEQTELKRLVLQNVERDGMGGRDDHYEPDKPYNAPLEHQMKWGYSRSRSRHGRGSR